MTVLTEIAGGTQRNLTFRISGQVTDEFRIEIPTKQKLLKLSSAAWLIEEKMGFILSWDPDSVLMPLESRSNIRFDHAIPSPDNWEGSLWLTPFKVSDPPMAFFILLDFDK